MKLKLEKILILIDKKLIKMSSEIVEGLEPATLALRVRCSTTVRKEHRQVGSDFNFSTIANTLYRPKSCMQHNQAFNCLQSPREN